jgi:DNA-binding transcriptional MerR regulator
MKPAEIAGTLEVSVATVRAWSGEFKQFLSPNAGGGDGRHRDFSDHDLRILYFVKLQKRSSAPASEIYEALRQMQATDWEGLPYVPQTPTVSKVPMVPAAAADVALDTERRALLREIASLQERVDDLQRRLDSKDEEIKTIINSKDEQIRGVLAENSEEIRALTKQLAEVETELKLYRSGRLKPE